MKHWKILFNAQHLNAGDFPNAESDWLVTINRFDVNHKFKSKSGTEHKAALYINENSKPILLNPTISKSISKALGTPDINKWIGCEIMIYIEFGLKAFGEEHDVVRVRPYTQKRDVSPFRKVLEECKDLDALKGIWGGIPYDAKTQLISIKDQLKTKFENENTQG